MKIEDLYDKYHDRIYNMVYHSVHLNDVDDCYQNVMLKLCKSLKGFQGRSHIYSWIYRITKNEIYRYYKHKQLPMTEFNIELLESKQNNRVENLTSLIPQSKSGKALQLRLNGFNYQEISNKLKIPIGTVRSKINRVKSKIRKECKNKGINYV